MAVGDKGQSYMMEKITQRIVSYWNADAKTNNNKNHFYFLFHWIVAELYNEDYFWFHRIVAELYNEDLDIKQFIENQEDAAGPHCLSFEPMNQKMLKHCWKNLKKKEKLRSFLDSLDVTNYSAS